MERGHLTDDRKPATLWEMIFILSVLFGSLFLALLITEALNRVFGPMQSWAYGLVCVALIAVEFIIAIIWEKRSEGPAEIRRPEIWTPRIMQRGHARLYRTPVPSLGAFLRLFIGFIVGVNVAKAIFALWNDLSPGTETIFEVTLRILISGFATVILLLLIASFIAGLWPQKHKAE